MAVCIHLSLRVAIQSALTDVKVIEASIDNAHFHLEKVEDQVDAFTQSLWSNAGVVLTTSWAAFLEVQRVEKELHPMIEG